MSTQDYIPKADGAFDAWQANYTQYAGKNTESIGLTETDVDALEEAQNLWQRSRTTLDATRAAYESAVAAKDDAKKEYVALIRTLTPRIQSFERMDDAKRAALGITIPDRTATVVDAPRTSPRVSVDTSQRLRHQLDIRDSATPTKRAKPNGVVGAEISVAITDAGADAPTDAREYRFLKVSTRTPTTVEFEGEDAGKTAHYRLRWFNTKGAPGPIGPAASATIVG